MTSGLQKTILASSALAGLLNIAQLGASYNAQARAAFEPSWAEASTPRPKPVAATTPIAASTDQTPASTPVVVKPTPVNNQVETVGAKLRAIGLRTDFAADYLDVQRKTGVPWQILASVHYVETGQSGNTARRSYAGAIGPMQFMPATFAAYGADGDGNGAKDITGLSDSMLSAGRYLAANGAARGNYRGALYRYNHSNAYVDKVLSIARRLGL